MIYNGFVLLHIVCGSLSILAAVIAFSAEKGSSYHRKAGAVFVVNMLLMASSGAMLAIYRGEHLNTVAGALTFYLVVSAYLTFKDRKNKMKVALYSQTTLGFAVGSFGSYVGINLLRAGQSTIDGNPVQVLIAFSAIAVFAASFDVRMMLTNLSGKQRLLRHIWRMGFATFLAVASLFLGQSQVFPEFMRSFVVLALPVLATLLVTIFWFGKVRVWGLRRTKGSP